jgi:hypothetical protein
VLSGQQQTGNLESSKVVWPKIGKAPARQLHCEGCGVVTGLSASRLGHPRQAAGSDHATNEAFESTLEVTSLECGLSRAERRGSEVNEGECQTRVARSESDDLQWTRWNRHEEREGERFEQDEGSNECWSPKSEQQTQEASRGVAGQMGGGPAESLEKLSEVLDVFVDTGFEVRQRRLVGPAVTLAVGNRAEAAS